MSAVFAPVLVGVCIMDVRSAVKLFMNWGEAGDLTEDANVRGLVRCLEFTAQRKSGKGHWHL